jgi:hypothetical protein
MSLYGPIEKPSADGKATVDTIDDLTLTPADLVPAVEFT